MSDNKKLADPLNIEQAGFAAYGITLSLLEQVATVLQTSLGYKRDEFIERVLENAKTYISAEDYKRVFGDE